MAHPKLRSLDCKSRPLFQFWKSFRALFVLALLVVVTLNACDRSPSLQPLKVGITAWPGFDIILYAQEAGIFKQRGLGVEIVRFENQQDSARAVLRGALDASFSSLWDVMQVDSGEDRPEVLFVTNISSGSDGIVARAGIQSIDELKGKHVGAKLGTVNHLILLEALKLHQIKPETVAIEDVSNETAVELLRKGKLDAAVVWQPLLGETATAIKGKIIFTTAEVDSLVIDTVMTRSSVVSAKSAELIQLIQSWFDVMQAVDTKPTDVYAQVGNALGQTGASFGQDYAGLKKGDVAMQQRMFQSASRLRAAIAQMTELLKADPRSGRVPREDVEINAELVTSAISTWKS